MPPHHVATAAQAALLIRPDLRPLLQLLMQGARSAAEVARELGMPLARASYLLGQLQRAGVAGIERVDARAGRPIKRYRVAPRWFIPYGVTAAATLDDLWLGQLAPRMAQLATLAARQTQSYAPVWGLWLSQGDTDSNLELGDETGPAHALFAGDEPLMLTIATLRLGDEQARRLKGRMLALLKEAAEWETPGAAPHTLSLLLVRGAVD
ncbi:winged helix-turn-helix domain-containing protein [Deinococcus sp. HMF7604]|uniref:winged helix-turn-helix domain-containing protein n=1 Tax=Deinococcus betulae TaxID=2873312 RepID=UPI001CCFC16A|nr:winged helix-turn-helix domain-containing protein [Deinococcus betulae]